MHRSSERRAAAAQAQAVDQQHDAPDALYRERGQSDRMRMPHERDQAVGVRGQSDTNPTQAEVIGQAAEDLARGLRDTDCRGQPSAPDNSCPPRPRLARPRMRSRGATAAAPARLGRAGRRMRRTGP